MTKKTAEKRKIYIRKPYERQRYQTQGGGPNLTSQSEKASSDINTIVELYHRTGNEEMLMPDMPPVYADVSDLQKDLTENAGRSRELIAKFNADMAQAQKQRTEVKEAKAKAEKEQMEKDKAEWEARKADLELLRSHPEPQ